jgi:hypothetical protein
MALHYVHIYFQNRKMIANKLMKRWACGIKTFRLKATCPLNNIYTNLDTKKYFKNNKYKQYCLVDTGYDTKHIRNIFTRRGYTHIIKPNKRSGTNRNLTHKQYTKYKKKINYRK